VTDDLWPEQAPTDDVDQTDTPDAAVAPASRLDRVREVLRLEGLAAAARARAAAVRDELDAEARAELAREGTAPTWRMADIGTVALPVSKEAIFVVDPAALLEWCRERHPQQVRTVHEVYPAYQNHLLTTCVIAEGVAADPETGEVVPGLAVRPGGVPRTLTIKPEMNVKAAFAQHGARWLDDILGGTQ
jgi:hypothetical protein